MKLIAFLIVSMLAKSAYSNSLRSLPQLHPMDTFTADTFAEGEWSYFQPPIPAPGYSFWGITDSLTMQLDYTAWLGGVPSLNMRYQFTSNKDVFQIAIEGMYIYLKKDLLKDMDKDDEKLLFYREDQGVYLRVNNSVRLGKSFKFYASYGQSYAKHFKINNESETNFIGAEFNDYVEDIWQFGVSFYMTDDLLFVANQSYGETWLYFENRPRKKQTIYGFRWKPGLSSSSAFWKNMTVDLAAIFVEFEDADYKKDLPIPVFPLVSWRWK